MGVLPNWLSGKKSAWCFRRHGLDPWVGKIQWRKKWLQGPTPVFLLRKSQGQRNLVGYSPQEGKRVGHNFATEHSKMLNSSFLLDLFLLKVLWQIKWALKEWITFSLLASLSQTMLLKFDLRLLCQWQLWKMFYKYKHLCQVL